MRREHWQKSWEEAVLYCAHTAGLLEPSCHFTLLNRCFPLPVFQIISQKDEHCWVGELNGLRGESRTGFVGQSGAGYGATIHPQQPLWQVRSKDSAWSICQGQGECWSRVWEQQCSFLEAAGLGSILLAQGGWLQVIFAACGQCPVVGCFLQLP